MIERNNYGLAPLCESGKEKFISGAADFGTAAQHGAVMAVSRLLSLPTAIISFLYLSTSVFS